VQSDAKSNIYHHVCVISISFPLRELLHGCFIFCISFIWTDSLFYWISTAAGQTFSRPDDSGPVDTVEGGNKKFLPAPNLWTLPWIVNLDHNYCSSRRRVLVERACTDRNASRQRRGAYVVNSRSTSNSRFVAVGLIDRVQWFGDTT
jgi:hypothetical protein